MSGSHQIHISDIEDRNIIGYCNRPFDSLWYMNYKIIRRWNEKVAPDDIVYHLGDFCMGNKEKTNMFRKQLNGYIILLKGNHDKHSDNWFLDAGFNEVTDKQIQYKDYIFSHYPITQYSTKINVHGHIHANLIKDNRHVNVCVECTDYSPILITDIPDLLIKQNTSIDDNIPSYKEFSKWTVVNVACWPHE
jgi:calcineurin-like phosphoesterase family protein